MCLKVLEEGIRDIDYILLSVESDCDSMQLNALDIFNRP